MVYHGGKLDVKMSGEPVGRLESLEDLHGWARPQGVVGNVFGKELFPREQGLDVAVVVDPPRPVVTHHDLRRPPGKLQLLQPKDVQVPDMVDAPHGALGVGRALVTALQVVATFEDPCAINSQLMCYLTNRLLFIFDVF